MKTPFANSYWLEPGRILCGEYPRDFDDLSDHAGMTALLAAGTRVFVDLTKPGELKPYEAIARSTAQTMGLDPLSLAFYRHPVRDVSVPKNPRETRAILRTLRLSRHRHEGIYLHCWGGRGRTGTVAGCFLSDVFGRKGQEALDLLGERWNACAKSADSESPETNEQRQYVRDWPPEGLDGKERIRGALLGAAVGDALGVPVEFEGRSQRRQDPVAGLRGYGTHHQPAGTWSDDTSMILATLAGLRQAGACDAGAIMGQFLLWLENGLHTPHGEVFDIGIATRSALRRYQSGIPATACGGTDERSNGNGSLMRILPVGLAFADDPGLVGKAADLSSLTHAHERSRFCCAFYCLVVSDLRHGSPLREATAFAWDILDHRWEFSEAERPRFEALHPDRLFSREEDSIGSGGHVIDTLEAALWVNDRHDDFAGAVLHAVNLGDDTDTTGGVAGGLAGLIHGESAIPPEWRKALAKREELEALSDDFAAFCEREARSRCNTRGLD